MLDKQRDILANLMISLVSQANNYSEYNSSLLKKLVDAVNESPAPPVANVSEPDYKGAWEAIKEYVGYPDGEDVEFDALMKKLGRIEKAHNIEVTP